MNHENTKGHEKREAAFLKHKNRTLVSMFLWLKCFWYSQRELFLDQREKIEANNKLFLPQKELFLCQRGKFEVNYEDHEG